MTEQQRQQLEALQKQLGDRGEDFALRYERQRLHAHPRSQDVHLIGRHDVGMGYDIISFMGPTSTTHDRYIEVKTYSDTPHFFLSAGEQAAAQKYGDSYFLYLVDINKVTTPGYTPLVIQDPIRNLKDTSWQEKVSSREYIFHKDTSLPTDLDTSTILVGCFRSNEHLNWIRRTRLYNVRSGYVNGAVSSDDVTQSVRYLLLYSSISPQTYRLYTVVGYHYASREEMQKMNYPHPHASRYILYHLKDLLDSPPIDILRILRFNNDKIERSSGTPIYINGTILKTFLLGGPTTKGIQNVRTYTNQGKPWSQMQMLKLSAMYQEGTDIALLAHHFKRSPQEIRSQLIAQHLLPQSP